MKSYIPTLLGLLASIAAGNPVKTGGELGPHFPMVASRKRELNSTVLSYHPAPNRNGNGVLITPGGGYSHTSLDLEGAQPAAWLNEHGYDAWILDYATASKYPAPLYPLPQNQALEAIKQIRAQNVVKKLGIWGFSAGGHLSATTVTNPEAGLDFGILAYPVITMDPKFTHNGSRTNLIGSSPSPELQYQLSAENRVTNSTPPVFLFHTANDNVVPIQNTLLFANAMATHGRPFDTLILPDGKHGLGLALADPVRSWTTELDRWLKYSV
ncbi:endo-1,4-beta-xylanase B [Byssothecium circinans]|uniref:Endo-1,4-beta-xylanase B n=1 Tax=Byssothecium circinans TaxID=147558 RepID=A0A6A5TII2_9PLEO|nr:endo-1,4-beta-xylanase B [Byssothecium circinans]